MSKFPFLAAVLAALTFASPPAATAADAPPVVVELYTSQGCNSCPPADALLMELAARPDILALGFHVDYWDYLGWKDDFALHDATTRQQAYGAALGGRYVYTPEMVIDGTNAEVGSDRAAVAKAITAAAGRQGRLVLTAGTAPDGTLHVGLPAAESAIPAVLWLVRYAPKKQVAIRGGENAGKTLTYANVVREILPLATWSGAAADIPVPVNALEQPGQRAVLLQAGNGGRILGALRLPDSNERH